MAVKVYLSGVRGSFLKLGVPEEYKPGDGKPRWSAAAMVSKEDKVNIAKVEAGILEAAKEKWGPKAEQMLKALRTDKNKFFWQDGDVSTVENYAGHMVANTHRGAEKGRPLVFDSDKTPIYDLQNNLYPGKGGRIYSGCKVNIEFEIWIQDNTHGKAVRGTLLAIQRAGGGDAFGGGSAPTADAFGEVAEGADADDIS